MKYLRDRRYYDELYDKFTVEKCLWHENFIADYKKKLEAKGNNTRFLDFMLNIEMYHITGERYANKGTTIQDWIRRDEKYDDIYQNTPIPDTDCFICFKPMELVCKNLKTDFDSYKAFVDFYFKCTSCKVCSTVSGASREDRIPWQCPECRGRLNTESKRLKNKIKTVDACSKCSYKDVTEIDLTTTERKPTKKEQTKFIEDKARFCLTDFEGQKYLEGKRSLNAVTELMKIMESEPKQEPKIRVLSIKQVQDLIRKILKKKKFENISFSVPEIRRDIIFTMKAIDSESRSWATVKKLLIDEIKKELKETNWNLMNEGINSKLGLIEARFRGREVHQEREYALDNVIL